MKCYGDVEVGCCSVGVLHYYGTAVLWCCSVVCDDVWLLVCHCCDVTVSLICLNGCFSVSESMSVTDIHNTYIPTELLLEVLSDLKICSPLVSVIQKFCMLCTHESLSNLRCAGGVGLLIRGASGRSRRPLGTFCRV